jgi:hypothetical protein
MIIPAILLTSAMRVSAAGTKLVDENERIGFILESLERWLSIAPQLRLVICDGLTLTF